jgi:hypothetical protein
MSGWRVFWGGGRRHEDQSAYVACPKHKRVGMRILDVEEILAKQADDDQEAAD